MKIFLTYLVLIISSQHFDKENRTLFSYSGWWIHGESYHVFKDEISLEEWNLKFLSEDLTELEELYLDITEMEYFPMECVMQGYIKKDTLYVVDFDITYVQGCGE